MRQSGVMSRIWFESCPGAKLYKPISDYLNEKVEELTFWGKTLHYHKPLSYYFGLLEENGFCVTSLKEPIASNKLLRKYPEWKYHTRIPSFIALKAILRSKESASMNPNHDRQTIVRASRRSPDVEVQAVFIHLTHVEARYRWWKLGAGHY